MRPETARRASAVSLLVVGFALLTPSAPAFAGTSRIAWDRCAADGGADSKIFSCDANDAAPLVLVVSFQLDAALPGFSALDGLIEVRTPEDSSDPQLPDWWQLYNVGACRQSALTVDADFSAIPPGTCRSAYTAGSWGAIGAYNFPQPGRARLIFGFLPAAPETLVAHRQYEACRLVIDNSHTSGEDACNGCRRPMCIAMLEVNAYTSGSLMESCQAEWEGEYGPTSTATWNCGYQGQVPSPYWPGFRWACLSGTGCATPARNRTWGQIKALYR